MRKDKNIIRNKVKLSFSSLFYFIMTCFVLLIMWSVGFAVIIMIVTKSETNLLDWGIIISFGKCIINSSVKLIQDARCVFSEERKEQCTCWTCVNSINSAKINEESREFNNKLNKQHIDNVNT